MDRRQHREWIRLVRERGGDGLGALQPVLAPSANDELNEEWSDYLDQPRLDVQILEAVCNNLESRALFRQVLAEA